MRNSLHYSVFKQKAAVAELLKATHTRYWHISEYCACAYENLETKKPDLFDQAIHTEHILYSTQTTRSVTYSV